MSSVINYIMFKMDIYIDMKLLDILNKNLPPEITIDHEQKGDFKERMANKAKTIYDFYKNGRIKTKSGCVIKYSLSKMYRIHISVDEGVVIYIHILGGEEGIKLYEGNNLCNRSEVNFQQIVEEIEKRFKLHGIILMVPLAAVSTYTKYKPQ